MATGAPQDQREEEEEDEEHRDEREDVESTGKALLFLLAVAEQAFLLDRRGVPPWHVVPVAISARHAVVEGDLPGAGRRREAGGEGIPGMVVVGRGARRCGVVRCGRRPVAVFQWALDVVGGPGRGGRRGRQRDARRLRLRLGMLPVSVHGDRDAYFDLFFFLLLLSSLEGKPQLRQAFFPSSLLQSSGDKEMGTCYARQCYQ